MIVHNRNKSRRSFKIGKQIFNFVSGDNKVPDLPPLIKFVNMHPDLSIIVNLTEPRSNIVKKVEEK